MIATMTMSVKPSLLVIADHCVPTGFARVAENICRYLKEQWELSVIGLNYKGEPNKLDYPVWPALYQGDLWGFGTYDYLMHSKHKPDAILVINDPWIVNRFATEIDRGDVPMAAYMPIDGKCIGTDMRRGLNNIDLAIFYTKFGESECRRVDRLVDREGEVHTYGFTGKSQIIPHGVNTDVYRPIDREVARAAFPLPQDAYIVGNVNRNQPRKRLDLTIEYFAEWVRQYRLPENVKLFLHCAQQDAGWNLLELGRYYGIESRLILQSQEAVTAREGLPEEAMPYLYSSFDVHVSTTAGEGWGLPNIEAAACAVPQIVPNWSALGEWAAGAAYFVSCTSTMSHIGVSTLGGLPDKHEFILALDRFYREPNLRRKYAELGLVRARDPRFRWDRVADLFQCHLGQMLLDKRVEVVLRSKEKEEISDGEEVAAV